MARLPTNAGPGQDFRVGRRTIQRRLADGGWRDIREVGLAILIAVVTMSIVVAAFVAALGPGNFRIFAPTAPSASAGDGTPPTVDLEIVNLISSLPDGRQARGTFTLRMREADAPPQAVEAARRTPTPVREGAQSGIPRAPSGLNPTESLVRDTVNQAMGSLGYEQIKGEEGKARLKQTVRDAVNSILPKAPVEEVFLREYIVQ